ncbi:hypothetical protein E8E12_011479 [Didymella heteroderae]|uniref:Uncharacterized protein n=1 Tax=Didymella heteroderae TaxID=1769908 RepID=A0A9P5C761_9PLEO|nr:hypothetical protein E8E12_011479 [Didymella heteroderae]
MAPPQLAMRKWPTTKRAGIATFATVIIVASTLYAVGFGPGGVRNDSFAARWQSRKGKVERGSIFSTLQSAGAGGSGALVVYALPAAGAAAAVVGLAYRASVS